MEDEHDKELAEAVRKWCDTEHALGIASGETEPGTFVGEWALIVSRQGLTADGEPISQWFDTSDGGVSRKLGLLRVATIKAEQYLTGDW